MFFILLNYIFVYWYNSSIFVIKQNEILNQLNILNLNFFSELIRDNFVFFHPFLTINFILIVLLLNLFIFKLKKKVNTNVLLVIRKFNYLTFILFFLLNLVTVFLGSL